MTSGNSPNTIKLIRRINTLVCETQEQTNKQNKKLCKKIEFYFQINSVKTSLKCPKTKPSTHCLTELFDHWTRGPSDDSPIDPLYYVEDCWISQHIHLKRQKCIDFNIIKIGNLWPQLTFLLFLSLQSACGQAELLRTQIAPEHFLKWFPNVVSDNTSWIVTTPI